jgi:hypothetical protein
MFWILLLAHFIADYPLQLPWILRAKRTLGGLSAHIAMHIVVMGILVSPTLAQVWPQVVAVAVAHFALDAGKNAVMRWRPRWVVRSYLTDQALHMLVLWLACTSIAQRSPAAVPFLPPHLAVVLSGYLLATYVWFISERILAHQHDAYVQEINRFATVRMAARGLLLTIFLALAALAFGPARVFAGNSSVPASPAQVGLALATLPYLAGTFRRRAAITDTLVAFGIACGVTAQALMSGG